MLRIFEAVPRLQRVLLGALGVAVGGLAVFEGFTAPTPETAVGIAVCGLLAVAALFLPDTRPAVVGGIAGLSAAFSVVCAQLAVRADNTFGMVELLALSWLGVRVILQHPFWRATGLFAGLTVAAVLLPLRVDDDAREVVLDMMGVIAVGMAFMGLLGLYLRLRDRMRVDRREFDRQAQRLAYARDLHDFVAHHVTAIVAQTKAVRFTTAAGRRPPVRAGGARRAAGDHRGGRFGGAHLDARDDLRAAQRLTGADPSTGQPHGVADRGDRPVRRDRTADHRHRRRPDRRSAPAGRDRLGGPARRLRSRSPTCCGTRPA